MNQIDEYDSYDVPEEPLFKHTGSDEAVDGFDDENDTTLGAAEEVVVRTRRKIAKLDDTKLLGPQGIPKLKQKVIPRLKFKGKGHERRDLAKILGAYQIWAHELFPKANFADFIAICKKAGASRSLKVHRRQWVDDERYGVYRWAQGDGTGEPDRNEATGSAEPPELAKTNQSVTAPTRTSEPDGLFVDDDDDLYEAPSRPANTSAAKTNAANGTQQQNTSLLSDDDDDELLDLVGDKNGAPQKQQQQQQEPDDGGVPDDDELAMLEQEAIAGYAELGF